MDTIEKMRIAMTEIAMAPPEASFGSVIAQAPKAFEGLHVIYATRAHDSYVQQIKLDRIEAACPLVCSLFDGSGLLFFSDRIHADMKRGEAPILLDFSIGLDKNLCDNIRRYVAGRGIDLPDQLRQLLQLVRGRGEMTFNYDYFAYMVEEYEHFFVRGNDRPASTVFALKVIDHLDEAAIARFPASPLTPAIERAAWQATQETLGSLFASDALGSFQLDQRAVYAILLKALLFKWADVPPNEALGSLTRFSLEVLGKFAKREVYFSWKLMGGDGKSYPFFQPAFRKHPESLTKLKGMSWDLTMLRWGETMSGMQRSVQAAKPDFFLPFLASNDRRFRDMVIACPLKAIVMDREHKMVNSIFRDELAFQTALKEDMQRCGIELGSMRQQARRLGAELGMRRVNDAVARLEAEARTMFA